MLKNGSNSENSTHGENICCVSIEKDIIEFLFVKYDIKHRTKVTIVVVTINGINEMGFEIPTRGYKTFIKNPANIKIKRLIPIEYKNISIVYILCNPRIRSARIPGINTK